MTNDFRPTTESSEAIYYRRIAEKVRRQLDLVIGVASECVNLYEQAAIEIERLIEQRNKFRDLSLLSDVTGAIRRLGEAHALLRRAVDVEDKGGRVSHEWIAKAREMTHE